MENKTLSEKETNFSAQKGSSFAETQAFKSAEGKNFSSLFSKIAKSWFLDEPLLFSVFSRHSVVPNKALSVPLRTGKFFIEYSPELVLNFSFNQLEAALHFEMLRVLLGHPYGREPLNVKKGVLYLASDIIVSRFYKNLHSLPYEPAGISYLKFQASRFKNLEYPLGKKWDNTEELKFFQRNLQINPKNGELLLVDDLTFEQWYRKLIFLIKETSSAGTENAGSGVDEALILEFAEESTDLWEENSEALDKLKSQIHKAHIENGFGTCGGSLEMELKESCDFSFDYRRALTKFRSKIVSEERYLTRMRPSRRYGFSAMGSRYHHKANVLIAVDVSASITEESFSHFYKAITNFFFLGIIERIDLIFFDAVLKNSTPLSFKKTRNLKNAINLKALSGKGGTNFQPAVDYFCANCSSYSGMIIFTDGEGNPPVIQQKLSGSASILWILDSRLSYEKSSFWINALPQCSSTYLPF